MAAFAKNDFAVAYVRNRNPTFSVKGLKSNKQVQAMYQEARRLFEIATGLSPNTFHEKWISRELPTTTDNNLHAADCLMLLI